MAIMQKHGATDGSTPHSVREAFSEFVFTPLITGDDFKKAPEPKKEYGPVAPVGAYPQGRAWYPGPQGPPVQQVYRGPPGQQGQFGRPAPQGHQGQAGHPGHAGYQGHQGHAGHSGQLGPPGQQYLPQKFNPQGPPGPNHQQRPAPNQPHGQPARHGESQGQPDNKPGHQHEQAPKPSEESHKGCKEKKKSKS